MIVKMLELGMGQSLLSRKAITEKSFQTLVKSTGVPFIFDTGTFKILLASRNKTSNLSILSDGNE